MELEQVIFAQKVWYENRMVYIMLLDNREVYFSIARSEKLKNAQIYQVSNIEIICGGVGLHWPELDKDLSIAGILTGRFI